MPPTKTTKITDETLQMLKELSLLVNQPLSIIVELAVIDYYEKVQTDEEIK